MNSTILIVEDNEINRQLMRDLLSFRGYRVIEAANGEAGIKRAKKYRPDLIIMDIQMPVMDGFEAIRHIKEDPDIRDIKILAITSFAMKGDRERILAAGADYYMPKPIKTRDFSAVVESLVSGKHDKSN